ncbi:hypothetical protein [Nocardia rhamnosiphila]
MTTREVGGPLRDPAALGAPGTATGTTCRADEALPVAAPVRAGTVTMIGADTAPREGAGALLRYA